MLAPNNITKPFEIKFIIFNNIPLTKQQNIIRKKLCKNDDLKKILKESCCELNDMIKFLDRVEPSICSLDEHKQLRMSFKSLHDDNKKESNSFIFNQNHSMCKEYFSIDELTIISQKIKEKIEDYLHYEIKLLLSNTDFKLLGHKYTEGNKAWERKPSDNPEWAKYEIEDLFLCHKCKGWFSYLYYNQGKIIALCDRIGTYEYMNDDEDRGGRRWACNYCMDKILYDNNIITITNIDCKIIKFKYKHPILN